jgi:hypothetical protein
MNNYGTLIMPDLPDFVSPIDGRVIHGRRGLREHNKELGVTNTADYTEQWKRQAKERGKAFTPGAGYDSKRRKEHLIRAFDQHSRSKNR